MPQKDLFKDIDPGFLGIDFNRKAKPSLAPNEYDPNYRLMELSEAGYDTGIDKLMTGFRDKLSSALNSAITLMEDKGLIWRYQYLKYQEKSYTNPKSSNGRLELSRILPKDNFGEIEEKEGIAQAIEEAQILFRDFLDFVLKNNIPIEAASLKNFLLTPFKKELENQDLFTKRAARRLIKRAARIPDILEN